MSTQAIERVWTTLLHVDQYLNRDFLKMIEQAVDLKPSEWTVIHEAAHLIDQERFNMPQELFSIAWGAFKNSLEPNLNTFLDLCKSLLLTRRLCDEVSEQETLVRMRQQLRTTLANYRSEIENFRAAADRIDQEGNEVKILFLAADPTNASRLRLGQELREIREKLQLARMRDKFQLNERMSVRITDISQALLDIKPHVVHFSGHGTSDGELCFEDVSGRAQTAPIEALASLFDLVSDSVQCVLLNACYSRPQGEAIATHIPHVIGMKKAIGDQAAVFFAVGFYQALGAGRTIEDAYKLGCIQIHLQGISENLTPILIMKK